MTEKKCDVYSFQQSPGSCIMQQAEKEIPQEKTWRLHESMGVLSSLPGLYHMIHSSCAMLAGAW